MAREMTLFVISCFYGMLLTFGPVIINCLNHFSFFIRTLTAGDVVMGAIIISGSGLAGIAGRALSAALTHIGIPDGLGLFLLLRPLSGSGALAEMSSIFNTYGPDSPQGIFASVLMGSTETIFYTIPVYLSAAGLKSSAKAVIISLVSMLAGVLSASLLLNIWG